MIVMKFGGTSVESAAAIERVASIVKARAARRPLVVVSAMGKTTNRLLKIASDAVNGQRDRALEQVRALRDFHKAEARAVVSDIVQLETFVDEHCKELSELIKGLSVLGELTPRSLDTIASYGERLSSLILTLALQKTGLDAVHADARTFVVTDRRHTQAAPLLEKTYQRLCTGLRPLLELGQVVVMGGFIAATEDGITTTLGRGGSDFSAALAGAGIGAEEIQIWTDVDGMMTADPGTIPTARRLRVMSFSEASELAYFGAKVLHPSTVLPAVEKNIPVLILNSRRPEVEGTRIVAEAVPCRNPIKSIACKRNITAVNIHSTRMLMAHGFLHRIFEAFDRYETAVDMVSTSEVSVSATIDNPARLEEICADLRLFSEVTVERNRAIVCLVGENIRGTPGIGTRIFGALSPVNVRMVSQGGSPWNLSLVVAEDDLLAAVRLLHDEFFRELDPTVFE